jgi:hypothetical protein
MSGHYVCGCGGLCDSGHPCPMQRWESLPELTAEEKAAADALPADFVERILRGERPVTDPDIFAN